MLVGDKGLQNIHRKNKNHIIRLEQPLVPKNIPLLNLSRVGFWADFFQKDYWMANKGENDQMTGNGYKLKKVVEGLGWYNIQSTKVQWKEEPTVYTS